MRARTGGGSGAVGGMEEEEALAARSTHAGVARSDDAAFAERVEKWRRDEVERERRLERMRETLGSRRGR